MADSPPQNMQLKSSGVLNINAQKDIPQMEQEESPKKTRQCTGPGCTRTFSCTFNLKRHMKSAHKIDTFNSSSSKTAKTRCLHPSCNMLFVHVSKMLSHLESDHGVEIQRENLQFKSLDEFYKWKENEQTTNFVYFCKYQGAGVPRDSPHMVLYFKCQRDGSQRSHRPAGQPPKTNKLRGTVKMGMVCPARMFVKIFKHDGSVSVEYIQSHSHPITAEDCKRQPMPVSLRSDIEEKLGRGMTEDQIMTALTGGAYLPTGKQGDRSGYGKKGDRSSINYGIPVENGVYFINKKRLSMMRKRRTSIKNRDEPPLKKKKTYDDLALEVAVIRGQLKNLSEKLDDAVIRETMLPEIHSLVTYLLNSCNEAKKAKETIPVLEEVNTQEIVVSSQSQTVSSNQNVEVVPNIQPHLPDLQPAPGVHEQSTASSEDPTFYFSDGKNVIKVAIKKRGKVSHGMESNIAATSEQEVESGDKSSVPSISQINASNDKVSSPSMSQLIPVSNVNIISTSPAFVPHISQAAITDGNGTECTAPSLSSVVTSSNPVAAPSAGNQVVEQDQTITCVPVAIARVEENEHVSSPATSKQNDVEMPQLTMYNAAAAGETITETSESNSDLDQESPKLVLEAPSSNETEIPSEQMEVIHVDIEQPPILYNLPTEGAYVTVCDVETEGGVDCSGESSQDHHESASVLLNSIIAANIQGSDQGT